MIPLVRRVFRMSRGSFPFWRAFSPSTLHELHLDGVLNGLNAHLALAAIRDVVGYLLDKSGIFTLVGMQHGLANGCHDFLFVESNDASVTLYYCLDHFSITFTIDV